MNDQAQELANEWPVGGSQMTDEELAKVIDEGERWLKYLDSQNDIVTTFMTDAVRVLKNCR